LEKSDALSFKQALKNKGLQLLKERMDAAELAMQQAQDAANQEEKSSAGDKFETGRAMSQQNKDMNARQLEAARLQWQQLQIVPVDSVQEKFTLGALARINGQYYFLSAGLGAIFVYNQQVWFLSPMAPLSKVLFQKQAGDSVVFQGKTMNLEEVF
jgi:hypothetical protein